MSEETLREKRQRERQKEKTALLRAKMADYFYSQSKPLEADLADPPSHEATARREEVAA